LYHTGPNGVLYGSIDYYRLRDNNGNKIPYYPWLKGNATYGYEFVNGFLTELSLLFNSDRYTDIANTKKLDAFFDLGIKFTYKVDRSFILNLELMNLLNRNIYYWDVYKEKPVDLKLGLNYLFD